MKTLITVICITALCFYGCQDKETSLEFEQKVLDQLLISLVDSSYKDNRLYTLSPRLGKDLFDKNGKWIDRDTLGQGRRDEEYELERKALKNDTVNLVIAINDTVNPISDEDMLLIAREFPDFKLNADNQNGPEKYKLDLASQTNHKFLFKYISELPRDIEFKNWENKYKKFAGSLMFSRIQFDNKKENGVLSIGYYCGGKCGVGYLVFIKKINDNWVIDKVVDTWIA